MSVCNVWFGVLDTQALTAIKLAKIDYSFSISLFKCFGDLLDESLLRRASKTESTNN